MINEFKAFIARGNVIDLAVGIIGQCGNIIGTQPAQDSHWRSLLFFAFSAENQPAEANDFLCAAAFEGFTMSFTMTENKVTGLTMIQGTRPTAYKRVEESGKP